MVSGSPRGERTINSHSSLWFIDSKSFSGNEKVFSPKFLFCTSPKRLWNLNSCAGPTLAVVQDLDRPKKGWISVRKCLLFLEDNCSIYPSMDSIPPRVTVHELGICTLRKPWPYRESCHGVRFGKSRSTVIFAAAVCSWPSSHSKKAFRASWALAWESSQ